MPIIRADLERCEGYGNCVIADPDHFDLDDEGVVVVLAGEIPEAGRAAAENAARACPVAALAIEER